MANLRPFGGPEHAPFVLSGGASAALLVHGFPGTPAEMRPAAQVLHSLGWTVESILLPGFGPEIPEIEQYRWEDWRAAVVDAAVPYLRANCPLLLMGNSVGGALCISVAAEHPVAALVLVAPFWRSHRRVIDLAFPAIRPFLRKMRPFAKVNFADGATRQSLRQVFGATTNLDDPATQQAIRDLPLPIKALDQVRQAGRHGYGCAPNVKAPVLVLQGTDDPVAHPEETRSLVARLNHPADYVEMDGGHDLIRSMDHGALRIAGPLTDFARKLGATG
jgi:carboxylesterase